jgi:hypothetical protein
MIMTSLQDVADSVVRRAQRQEFILPREVREELAHAGQPESLWKDVVALARPSLSFRHGRYYYTSPVTARVRAEQSQQRDIHRAVRRLVRRHRPSSHPVERRGEDRVEFVQPVKVRTEDRREFTLITRDLSPTGVRLIGTRRLLGQKVQVLIPAPGRDELYEFVVRVLWTCPVGEDLVENGGTFLSVSKQQAEGSKQ